MGVESVQHIIRGSIDQGFPGVAAMAADSNHR